MQNYPIDLHMHSFYSDDGEFSPEQLAAQCRAYGVRVFAIADHNSVRANAAAASAAAAAGIIYVPAIEIDCTYADVNLHVLGYGIDSRSPDFVHVEQNILRQSRSAGEQMLRATQALGFPVTAQDMARLDAARPEKGCWTGEMFAEALLADPACANDPRLAPYRPGGARSDNPYVNFYWDYYSQGKPCYVRMEYPSLADTIALIHRSGGLAVLAHPGVNLKGKLSLLQPILDTGLNGVEAYSSYHSGDTNAYFAQQAQARGLLITCGSDYHGKTKPSIAPGASGCTVPAAEMYRSLAEAGLVPCLPDWKL